MKKLLLAAIILTAGMICHAQDSTKTKPVYNAELAKKLGADEYGMKKYVMAFLKRGPHRITDTAAAMKLQMAHLKNIGKLAKEGKLIVAGPFLDDQDIRGIFIFNVETIEEAKKLTETDPAVQAGSLIMELHPFYCSAALMEVVPIHNTIQKENITD